MATDFSVLDLSPISSGSTGAHALRNTLDLAQLADTLGYHRYWVAEHHNLPSVASSAPEVMIGHVASVTRRMRVGSGGIMLPNHSPLHVAETFRVLAALHPGRVDLGIGRAPGSDQVTAFALRGSKERLGADDFPEKLNELLAFGSGEFPRDNLFRSVRALPDDVPLPPVWLLGSSDFSARLAAELGLGFAFAHHFSPDWVLPASRAYRERFQPTAAMPRPRLILTVSAICAETNAEANRLATTLELAGLRRAQGRFAPLPSPEEALAYNYTAVERQHADAYRKNHFIGSPDSVQWRINELAEQTGADEIMINTMTHGHAERRRSYELLSEVFGLVPDPAQGRLRDGNCE
jgi:luciferase family oxidoreductase group 1